MEWNLTCCFFVSYYRDDNDVKDDMELQAFVNELSIDGTGLDGGRGQVIKKAFVIQFALIYIHSVYTCVGNAVITWLRR